jgi:type I restriction enzyme S subunit
VKLPAYPQHKQSGVAWLGDVPKHWELKRLKFYAKRVFTGTTPPSDDRRYYEDPTINWFTPSDFSDEGTLLSNSTRKLNAIAVQDGSVRLFEQACVLIVSIGATLGRIGIALPSFACNQQINIIVPEETIIPEFLFYSLLVQKEAMKIISNATTLGIMNQDKTKQIELSVPNVSEQQKIVDFLDWKTGQIDRLISKKKQLIEKLKEKRIALITRAVTKGLDPYAPMRDSGIPWLGEVPGHWEVMKYGYRTMVQEGQVDPEDEPYSEMLLIAPNHIESNTGQVFGLSTAREQAAISGKYLVRNGDVVYSKIRPHLNKCAVADFDGLCSADMYPIRTEQGVNSIFLFYWMLAQPFLDYATLCSMRVAMPKLNRETLGAAPLVVPPLNEQEGIVKYLDELLEKIDSLRKKIDEAIVSLTEYRTALITAATTGEIDVRNVKIGGIA